VALGPGTRLGPYEIAAQIGAGGMGEVYRARDTKLKRDVAIKVLPDAFARDAERLGRFRREAEVLATLNHPNIAAVYGLEETAEASGIVLELVDGETLADRIARGPIALDEMLPIARQIAYALEAAHEKGIVHRDLKPANIKLTADGQVKVLDFGLAKMLESDRIAAGTPNATASPTMISPAVTGVGMILGTAAYMSPEQARGRAVDTRADVWAFGCVLYEMLAGRRAFPGDDVSETLAAVIKSEPEWSALPADVPAALRSLIRQCLDKDMSRRVGGMAAARFVLGDNEILAPPRETAATSSLAGCGPRVNAVVATTVAAVIGGSALTIYLRPPPRQLETRLDVTTDDTYQFGATSSYALSPDGRSIVFAASVRDGVSQLWLRSLADPTAVPLPGTERGTVPFWSPDGRAVGFFSDSALKRIDLIDHRTQTLATLNYGTGGAWAPDGTVLFAPSNSGGLMLFRDGKTVPLLLQAGGLARSSPLFLPDGQQFLFSVPSPADARGVYAGARDGRAARKLVDADGGAAYLDAGWILYIRRDTLLAQPFDVSHVSISGEPVVVAQGVGSFAASRNGVIAYRSTETATANSVGQLRWFNRDGTSRDDIPALPPGTNPVIASDGRIAWDRMIDGNRDVWVFDGTRSTRLTSDSGGDFVPHWMPSGDRVVFSSNRHGANDLYVVSVNDPSAVRPILASAQDKLVSDISPDGRVIAFIQVTEGSADDIWTVAADEPRAAAPFLATKFDERGAVFSPDGRWMAYQSDESGRYEIYVRRFPARAEGGRQPVSTTGGIWPRWSRDGRELFYVDLTGAVMAAVVQSSGDTLGVAAPSLLFKAKFRALDPRIHPQYDVDRQGRFLIVSAAEGSRPSPITIILNWSPPTR